MGHKLSLGGYWLEKPPGESCEAFISSHIPDRLPNWAHKPPVRRRYFAERFFRVLHAWRNCGIVLGLPVPSVDEVTPRRWNMRRAFRSDESLKRLLKRVREKAREVDEALEGHSRASLPAPAAHVRQLAGARRPLSPIIDEGGEMEVLETDSDTTAAYRFTSQAGTALTVVNVGNDAKTVTLAVEEGISGFTEEVTGDRVECDDGRLTVDCPPHSVRLLRSGK
jgi:hypothetical protein